MTTPKPVGKPKVNKPSVVGALILAGGLATRMQGLDKGLVPFKGQPLVTHLLPLMTPHCQWLGISANRNQATYQRLTAADVVFGDLPEYAEQGPLAGLASAATRLPALDWLLVVPCDTPKLPRDLLPRLLEAASLEPNVQAWYARTDEGPQPSIMLLQPAILQDLPNYLARGERTLRGFLTQHQARSLHFPENSAFANGNRLQDLDLMA